MKVSSNSELAKNMACNLIEEITCYLKPKGLEVQFGHVQLTFGVNPTCLYYVNLHTKKYKIDLKRRT